MKIIYFFEASYLSNYLSDYFKQIGKNTNDHKDFLGTHRFYIDRVEIAEHDVAEKEQEHKEAYLLVKS